MKGTSSSWSSESLTSAKSSMWRRWPSIVMVPSSLRRRSKSSFVM